MKKDIVLLSSQSKSLIAKALVQYKAIQNAYKDSKILICKGTTNSYLVEEFTRKKFDKTTFTSGVVLPGGNFWINNEKENEKLINKGMIEDVKDISETLNSFSEKDIILKGANAINYAKSTAGILILNDKSGTVGHIVPAVFGKRTRLIVPVGLEKEVSFDLDEMSELLGESDCAPETPRMFSIRTELFTEIESIKVLCDNNVNAYHIGTGGIKGAQGAVRLLLDGDKECIEKICMLIEKLPLKDEFSA